MESLSPALLHVDGGGSGGGPRGPCLLCLLAHGNQLAEEEEGEPLAFPRCVRLRARARAYAGARCACRPVMRRPCAAPSRRSLRQLSLDAHLLPQLHAVHLPPACRQLALVGQVKAPAMRDMLQAGLPAVLKAMPDLQHLLLEPAGVEALDQLELGGPEPALVRGPGGWARPTRLPGQPRRLRHDQANVAAQLRAAGVEVIEVASQRHLPRLLSQLRGAAEREG